MPGRRAKREVGAAECMQVNCTAHLQLLRAVFSSRPVPPAVIPVVLISSDVIGQPMPATLVYAAAKAAAEEAIRHAAADLPQPGAAILVVRLRLPDIGIPMRAAAPGPRRHPAAPGTARSRSSPLPPGR